jgi:hypothetical protein
VLYSATARTNVAVRLIAVMKSTQTTAGTWAAVPTAVSQPTAPHPIAQAIARPANGTAGIGGVAVSASSGAFSHAGATFTDVTNLSVTITTTGRPVVLCLIDAGAVSTGSLAVSSSTTSEVAYLALFRDATQLTLQRLSLDVQEILMIPVSAIQHVDFPPSGTYTYKLQVKTDDASHSIFVSYAKLVAYEI